jgi:hypothetical protein
LSLALDTLRRMRRVVTGRDGNGKSVFRSDDDLDAATPSLLPGAAFARVWGTDTVPALPVDGVEPDAPRYFPAPGGFRFHVFTLPPATVTPPADLDIGAALAEFEAMLPGMAEYMEPDNPGMHTTNTIDIDLVLAGEIFLELDDGAEVRLGPGDVVVQNGTRHRWNNRSDAPCTVAVAIFGAHPAS